MLYDRYTTLYHYNLLNASSRRRFFFFLFFFFFNELSSFLLRRELNTRERVSLKAITFSILFELLVSLFEKKKKKRNNDIRCNAAVVPSESLER